MLVNEVDLFEGEFACCNVENSVCIASSQPIFTKKRR